MENSKKTHFFWTSSRNSMKWISHPCECWPANWFKDLLWKLNLVTFILNIFIKKFKSIFSIIQYILKNIQFGGIKLIQWGFMTLEYNG